MQDSINAIPVILALSVVCVAIFRRIHVPPILGYITVGLIIGPSLLNILTSSSTTTHLAEFGVVFLMFTVGLEFSLPQLNAMKSSVLGLGGLQVFVCSLVGASISVMFGVDTITSMIIGGIVAMSSTAIVVQLLREQLELNSRHGRNAIAILIFQDLAVIPFLILLPLMHDFANQSLIKPLSLAFIKGAIAFIVMLALGRWALRPMFRYIASARSTELFMLTVLLVALTAAWATSLADLSYAFGAFLAGAMLGETEFRHQIEANIRPFRDILLGLFFITIGMKLDTHLLISHTTAVMLVAVFIVVLKAMIIYIIARGFKLEPGVAVRTGLVLAQGGEFGLALISLAMQDNLLPSQLGQTLLAGTIISMVAGPFLIRHNGTFAKALCRESYLGKREQVQSSIKETSNNMSNHVVICGYGRVGQNVARFLEFEQIPYLALDVDPYVIQEARQIGETVFFGDSTHADILEAADVAHARIVVIALDDINATQKALAHLREINSKVPILIRTRDEVYLESLMQTGATEVVPEKFEASLALISHLLKQCGVTHKEIEQRMKDVRSDQYLVLRSVFHGMLTSPLEDTQEARKQLHSVQLPKEAYAVGKTLKQLALSDHKIVITAIKRGQTKLNQPNSDMVLYEDDVLVLFGVYEDIEHAEAKLLNG